MVALIVVVFSAFAIRYVRSKRAEKKREAAYQSALSAYSKDLRPGMTRKDVEDYLRAKGIQFQRMCCIEERSAAADLAKIGQEDIPWFCSENNVYVAFEFAATEPHEYWIDSDSDTLKRVSIFRWLQGCL